MYSFRHEDRITELRDERARCMKAARVARALQCDDLTLDMVREARDAHEHLMVAKRQARLAAA